MAYKCKTCGYVFKKSDTDLCPECFTARDDISCIDYGESHNHFKDSSDEKDSFIAEQLRQEASSTPDELGERFRDMTDGIRRGLSEDTPPNTYQKPSGTPTAGQSSFGGGNQRNTTYFNTGAGGHRYYTSADQMRGMNQNQFGSGTRRTAKAPGWVVVLILILFFSPAIATVIGMIGGIKEAARNAERSEFADVSTAEAPTEDSTIEEPKELHFASLDPYDEEIYLTVKDLRVAETFNSLEECRQSGAVEFIAADDAKFFEERPCYLIYCTVSLDDEGNFIEHSSFLSTDAENTINYIPFDDVSKKELTEYPLIVTEEFDEYLIELGTVSEFSSEGTSHLFNCYIEFAEIMRLAGVEGYTQTADSDGDAPVSDFDYNYVKAPFETSVKERNGTNVQISYTGNSAEMVPSSPEKEYITLFDEELEDGSWALYEVSLVAADQSHAVIDCRFKNVTVFAFDARYNCVFGFTEQLNGDLPEIPMCKNVQYYTIVIDYAEPNGNECQAEFDVSSSDLYNS